MTAYEASFSSSSMSMLWKYDVFLSFRGEDTRYGFTSHLHAALKARGYQVFIDEDDLPRGEEIKEKLFRAIEESRISVIIFSKMYADSSWCLDELVKIMECRDKLGRHVLPIFYHVDPWHVRKQDGDLAKAFQKHEKDILEEKDDKKHEAKQERVNQWREALTKAANLSGHHLQSANNRREAEFIKKIINENICEWLTSTNELHVAKHIVGIDSRVPDIITYLSSGGSNDVLMVGIWGMGGLGKTTAAKAIYNQIHPKFEFKSFLADIRNATSKHDLVDLQKKLISDILKKKPEISCVDEGIDLIKQQFRHRKILVIVDNIDKEEQLDAIVGSHDWFGPGSRIIITTRDERLLLNVDRACQAKKMNEEEALELFSWHAFINSCPNQGYLEVSEKVISYCGGLPLALEDLGDFYKLKLSLVNLKECKKLSSLPRGFYKLKSVETLLLTGCFKFREVHEDLGEMISLRILEAEHTAIRQIPSSTVRLKNLTLLSLKGVKLAHDAIPQDLGSLISLQVLDLRGNEFHTLPSLGGLTKLETLRLNDCFNLRTIPDLPTNLKFLYADNCPALETMPNFSEISNMTELKLSDSPKELWLLQDRISNLPHEILVSIVSLLPLKEAAATSILSRPWRHVWAFTTTLSFDAVNFEVDDTLHRFLDLEEQVRDRESRLYVNWVDHVLDQHRGQCIDGFRVCFFLQRDFAGSIDKWIQFAMEKRVQILELELLTDSIVFLDDNYTFPHKLLLGPEEQKGLFSNLPSLHPGGYSIAPFESLRVVRFQHVGVTGETLEFLLSNCPVLERLSLSFAKDLVKLRVTGTSMALKYLEVKYCRELSIIEISGANIVSFIYCGQLIDLRLSNVLKLVEVSIYKWGTFAEFIRLALSQLSCCLSHLETLKLDIRGAVYNQNHAFPALSNLKHLELLVDADYSLSLGRLASFMKAAPYLLNLVLGLGFSTSNKDMEIPEKVSKQPHHCLKLVEIAGYRGHECCVKHVRYLVENAVALEKIIINPVRFWCRPRGIESNALLENEEENARDHAIQHLKKKVPSSVEFVCL